MTKLFWLAIAPQSLKQKESSMCGQRRTRPIILVLLLATSSISARIANAGRKLSGPLLSQFEEGYGIVAAEVADAKLVNAESEDPATYRCTFKVHEVVAQPLDGKVFTLHSGDSIELRLSAGYACQIEDDPKSALAKGRRYYLVIRKNGDGQFEHADGASALRGVEKFDDFDTRYYARIRGLAAKPNESKLMAWVEVVKDPTESDRLRSDALAGVFTWLWPAVDAADSAQARVSLRKVWNDPQSRLSITLLEQLDYVLRVTDRAFEGSTDRRDVWLKNLLTLTPERKKDDSSLDNFAFVVLGDLAKKYPDATGEQLAKQVLNREWPLLYRRAIASGLVTAYCCADRVDPNWKQTIRSYFIDLMNEGEPFPIRVAAGDLEYFASGKSPSGSGIKRSYLPDDKVKAAMRRAVSRLTAASTRPGADQEFGNAAHELARVVQSLDEPVHDRR